MRVIYENEGVRVKKTQLCPLCSREGKLLYQDLHDHLFDVSGKWNLRKCLNPECGLLWIDPMPLKEEFFKLYKKYYTHDNSKRADLPNNIIRRAYQLVKNSYLAMKYGYRSKSITYWGKILGMLVYLDPGRRADLDFSVMYLKPKQKGLLLDVGCGNGCLLKRMQGLGWKVEGVDFDPIAVEYVRKKGLPVRLGSLETQQYPSNHFDAITMSHIIEHVNDPLLILKECHRILKDEGRLVIVTPNSESWGHKLFKDAWLNLDPPRHMHIFTTLLLCKLVERAGFKELKIQTTIRYANGLFIASRSIKRTGKYVMGDTQPCTVRIWARSMQLAEWAILMVKPSFGEEIALVAEKL